MLVDRKLLIEAVQAVEEHGSQRAASKATGIPRSTLQRHLKKARQLGLHGGDGVAQAIEDLGVNGLVVDGGWLKNKGASIRFRLPKAEEDGERLIDALREGLADVPAPPSIEAPSGPSDRLAVFPVADLHMGLLTDEEEVGENWDSKIAASVFSKMFANLAETTPDAGTALIAQLGDLTHTDDQRNVTPQSGHQLDADTRYFKILRCATAAMKGAIEVLRRKYPMVIYRGQRGNHDLTAHHAITLALAEHYEGVEGVKIATSAAEFYVHQFGQNMILLHHGDRAKPDRLAGFAAAEWPEVWGKTRHRIALSGHVHHEVRKEVPGMAFESVGTIIPRDAHAYSNAYGARRSLVSITFDREAGEMSRSRINA